MKKKYLIISAILTFGVFLMAFCPNLCPSTHHSPSFTQSLNCLFNVPFVLGALASLWLTLTGLLLQTINISIPDGFVFPPYKPPRFPS